MIQITPEVRNVLVDKVNDLMMFDSIQASLIFKERNPGCNIDVRELASCMLSFVSMEVINEKIILKEKI